MNVVDDFFRAYDERRKRNWGDELELMDGDERRLYDSQAAVTPGLSEGVVSRLLAREFVLSGTGSYRAFLEARSYRSLDCDGWVEFAPTASADDWTESVERMRGQCDPRRFFAVGYDAATSAVLCLERRSSSEQNEPVVSIVDGDRVLSCAFSSFDACLGVLTELLRSETVLYVERGTEPDDSQRELVARMRLKDPTGFGAVGWPSWYRRAIGGTQWGEDE